MELEELVAKATVIVIGVGAGAYVVNVLPMVPYSGGLGVAVGITVSVMGCEAYEIFRGGQN